MHREHSIAIVTAFLWIFIFPALVLAGLAVDYVRKVNTERLILRLRKYRVWL